MASSMPEGWRSSSISYSELTEDKTLTFIPTLNNSTNLDNCWGAAASILAV